MIRLSYILATDTYTTIRPVVDRLRRQTVRQEIELVLIAPQRSLVEAALAHQDEFGGILIVEHPVDDLAEARALGIRGAAGAAVFVGETHSYPHPEMVERLLAAMEQGYQCAAPGMGNANPGSARSWAGFLSDYGLWWSTLPGGEIQRFMLYNAAFSRDALLALGERLAPALSHGDELPLRMAAAGHRIRFVPEARLDHVNVAVPRHWTYERYAAGRLIAFHRSRQWSMARRWFYALCSPAIPFVLMWRVLPGIAAAARGTPLPAGTLPLIAGGFLVKGAGELTGYLAGQVDEAERVMQEYEVHKLAYAGRGKS